MALELSFQLYLRRTAAFLANKVENVAMKSKTPG